MVLEAMTFKEKCWKPARGVIVHLFSKFNGQVDGNTLLLAAVPFLEPKFFMVQNNQFFLISNLYKTLCILDYINFLSNF